MASRSRCTTMLIERSLSSRYVNGRQGCGTLRYLGDRVWTNDAGEIHGRRWTQGVQAAPRLRHH